MQAGILPEIAFGLVALQLLFLVSAVLRMFVALTMLPRVKEQHASHPYSDMGFILDASIVYPAQSVARHIVNGVSFATKEMPRKMKRR